MTSHLSPEQLLRHLDGELSRSAMRKTTEHLQACWTCQVELGRLRDHIATIFDAHAEVFAPSLPAPPKAWPRLEPRLDREAARLGVPLWRRLAANFGGVFRTPQVYAATAAVVGVVSLLIWAPLAPVSAKEVLTRAATADAVRFSITGEHVIRQRVRVKRTGTPAIPVQTAQLESWKSTKSTYWNSASDPVNTDLLARYQSNGLAEALPLSPPAVEAWVKLAGSEPNVSGKGETMEVQVASEAQVHGLEAVQIEVRRRDWHVDAMTLAFVGATFQITEEDSAILERREVPSDVLARLEPAVATPVRTAVATTVTQSVNLDDLEMAVRSDLHGISADLGESIEIRVHPPDRLVMNAWNVSPQRKEQLAALVANKPGVELRFEPPAGDITGRVVTLPPVAPPAQPRDLRLAQFFGSAQAQEDYARTVLKTGGNVLAHYYALRELAVRWPAEQEAGLSPAAKAQLAALVKDHANEIRSGVSGWETELNLLLKGLGNEVSDGTPDKSRSWRDASAAGLDAARRVDQTLRALLTVSDAPLSLDDALPMLQRSTLVLEQAVRDLMAAPH